MASPAKSLDAAIADRLVGAVTPLTVELALKALTSLEQRDQTIRAQWRRRIKRARYEADLAERRMWVVYDWIEKGLIPAHRRKPGLPYAKSCAIASRSRSAPEPARATCPRASCRWRTSRSGKITQLAVRDVVHGREVKNKEALANPEALEFYRDVGDLAH